jgi:flagellar biosynthesis activator protein FlaF
MSTVGYAKQQTLALETASPQETLAWGLTTTARKMAQVRVESSARETILDAVRLNWRLWTIIQAEQSDPDCPSPREIREGLLNLSNFVDKRSVEILANPDQEKIDTLISINRNIAAGLLGLDLTPEQRAERDKIIAASKAEGGGQAMTG